MKRFSLALLLAAALVMPAVAQTYKVAIVQVSTSESFKALMEAIGAATGTKFELQVVPGTRLVYLVENKQVDIGMPLPAMTDPSKIASLPYDYATASIYRNAYVLYSAKAKNLDIAEIKKANAKGYKLETGGSNPNQYGFPVTLSSDAEGSMKKVDAGRIDGYIYTQISADIALKATALKTIRRQLYDYFDLIFILQKGARGGPVDKLLADGMAKIKANGRFDAIMGSIINAAKYNDWQP